MSDLWDRIEELELELVQIEEIELVVTFSVANLLEDAVLDEFASESPKWLITLEDEELDIDEFPGITFDGSFDHS